MKALFSLLVLCFATSAFAQSAETDNRKLDEPQVVADNNAEAAAQVFTSKENADKVFRNEGKLAIDKVKNSNLIITFVEDGKLAKETLSITITDNEIQFDGKSAPLRLEKNIISLSKGGDICSEACLVFPSNSENLNGAQPIIFIAVGSFFGPSIPFPVPAVSQKVN